MEEDEELERIKRRKLRELMRSFSEETPDKPVEVTDSTFASFVRRGSLVNVDENPVVVAQYQIMSIPTLLVFKNGKLVDRIIGAMPKHILEQRITGYLS